MSSGIRESIKRQPGLFKSGENLYKAQALMSEPCVKFQTDCMYVCLLVPSYVVSLISHF